LRRGMRSGQRTYGLGFWLPTIVADMGVKSTLEFGMLTYAVSAALGGFGLVLSAQFSNYPVAALAALTLATVGVMAASPLFWSFPTAFLKSAAAAARIAS